MKEAWVYWNMERFKKIVKENNRLRKEASAKTCPKVEVALPAHEPEKYPLFIALHGWGDNITMLKQYWKSEKIKKEYITAFVQSSQVVSTHGFGWDDAERGRKEVGDMYNNVVREYPIHAKKVIIWRVLPRWYYGSRYCSQHVYSCHWVCSVVS